MSVAFEINLNINKELTPETVEGIFAEYKTMLIGAEAGQLKYFDDCTVLKLNIGEGLPEGWIEFDRSTGIYKGEFKGIARYTLPDICCGLPGKLFVSKILKTKGDGLFSDDSDGFKLTVNPSDPAIQAILTKMFRKITGAMEAFLMFGKRRVVQDIFRKLRSQDLMYSDNFDSFVKEEYVLGMPISAWLSHLETVDSGITDETKSMFGYRALAAVELANASNFADFERIAFLYASPVSLKNCGGEVWVKEQLGFVYRAWLNINGLDPNPLSDIEQYFNYHEVDMEDSLNKLFFEVMQTEERRVASLGQTPDNA